ncbi:MAG TPA: hypothetical protein VFJ19_09860 [Nocardioidaceae bacterium]|nr:hypothetical protein [Nocardioidaceae bacterium]
MRTPKKFFAALTIASVAAAGGAAFTASNTVPSSVAGYGTASVTGATATSVVHTLSADGTTIDSTLITFDASQTGNTVKAGFGSTPLEDCTVDSTDGTTATCTYAVGYDTATATSFKVAVS